MAEGNPENPQNANNQLSDSDISDEKPINPILKTSVCQTEVLQPTTCYSP